MREFPFSFRIGDDDFALIRDSDFRDSRLAFIVNTIFVFVMENYACGFASEGDSGKRGEENNETQHAGSVIHGRRFGQAFEVADSRQAGCCRKRISFPESADFEMTVLYRMLLVLPFLPILASADEIKVDSDFPGGSGEVERIDSGKKLIVLNPSDYPDRGWRCWWYVKIDGIPDKESWALDVGEGAVGDS